MSGPELIQKFQDQAISFGTEFRYEEVKQISKIGSGAGDGDNDSGYSNDGTFYSKAETDSHAYSHTLEVSL